jgi:soluble lytic murein transglycosylase-like protein
LKKIIRILLLVTILAFCFNNSYSIDESTKIVNNIEKQDYKSITKRYAEQNNINWRILYSILINESNLNEKAMGDHYKAFGLGQVHYTTAKLYDNCVTKKQLLNPDYNIRMSCIVFKDYLNRYNDNYTYAIAAYNAGPRAIDESYKYKTKPQNMNYVVNVLLTASKIDE